MENEARYLTDDRDKPAEERRELVIFHANNGDWYVQIARPGRPSLESVRLCTSGGASTAVPGLTTGIAFAYRSIRAAAAGKPADQPSYDELLEEVRAWRRRVPTHYFDGRSGSIERRQEEHATERQN